MSWVHSVQSGAHLCDLVHIFGHDGHGRCDMFGSSISGLASAAGRNIRPCKWMYRLKGKEMRCLMKLGVSDVICDTESEAQL